MTTFTKRTTLMFPNYELSDALTTLRAGGLILYPTDTLWSIGCDATNEASVSKFLNLVQNNASIEIIVDSIAMLKKHIVHLHPEDRNLIVVSHKAFECQILRTQRPGGSVVFR